MRLSGPFRTSILVGLALTGVLALQACGRAPQSKSVKQAAGADSVHPVTAGEILSLVREPGADAVLVNVWATWCEPCREEFPDLVRLQRSYRDRGLRLLFVSGDFDSEMPAVRRFLAQQGVDFRTYIKTGDDMKFIDTLNPRWSGALPATFVYDGSGRLLDFWEGKSSYAKLEEHVLHALRATHDSTEVRS